MWSISVVVNSVKCSKLCAKELFKLGEDDDIWYSLDEVTYKGNIYFNSDHMEHMDWLAHRKDLVSVLQKHKVKGDICFGSLDGDNAGQFWGYRFDGKGGMSKLVGKLIFEVE